jgi:ABC-type antimicrobial peptide transport system permease subunit
VEAVDPDQPLEGIQTAEAMVSSSISTPRFRTLLMTAFGLLALLLAGVACVALLIPARRATRLDPVRTLGEE